MNASAPQRDPEICHCRAGDGAEHYVNPGTCPRPMGLDPMSIPTSISRADFLAALQPLADLLNVDPTQIARLTIDGDEIGLAYVPTPEEAGNGFTWPQPDATGVVTWALTVEIAANPGGASGPSAPGDEPEPLADALVELIETVIDNRLRDAIKGAS